MSLPIILDATSSFRRMWRNKIHPSTVFMDIRSNTKLLKDWEANMIQKDRATDIEFTKLTIQADFTHLPFKDESFFHINYDPPQLIHLGKTSIYYKQFGCLEADTWRRVLKEAAKELLRVLKEGGTLNVKWNDRDISDNDVLALFPIAPAYGQVGSHGTSSKTSWFTFIKLPEDSTSFTS
jgi:hypothetical protein